MSLLVGNPLEEVRNSVAATRATGNASIRYVVGARGFHLDLETVLERHVPRAVSFLRRVADVAKPLLEKTDSSWLPGPDGRIDFVNERSIYNAGATFWKLYAPGKEYLGAPGEWDADDDLEDSGLPDDDPFWLLALLGGITEAAPDGEDHIRGVRCRRIRCTVSFDRASATSPRPLGRPLIFDSRKRDTSAFHVDVWIDGRSLIRQITLHGPDEAEQTTLQLAKFGEADSVDLPSASEVISAEDP